MDELIAFLNTYKEIIIGVLSALVALFSAFFARGETVKQRALLRETLREQIDRASVEWGRDAINAMAEAFTLAEGKCINEFEADKVRVSMLLSALADRGRLFFPNIDTDRQGAEKEGAFRGVRPPILDVLVFAHLEVKMLEPVQNEGKAFLNRCRRLLVSELQAHLDPRRRDAIVGRYDAQQRADRADALKRASALEAELESRWPKLKGEIPAEKVDA